MDKMPPLEKIYEAWSAVADGRVAMDADEGRASVTSSNGKKEYTVTWRPGIDGGAPVYSSNDNATYWQGYAGYPVIAVLMERGVLPLDRAVADEFAHVNWTELNASNKRDYAAAVAHVVEERGLDKARVQEAAQAVHDALCALDLVVKRGSVKPPAAKRG